MLINFLIEHRRAIAAPSRIDLIKHRADDVGETCLGHDALVILEACFQRFIVDILSNGVNGMS